MAAQLELGALRGWGRAWEEDEVQASLQPHPLPAVTSTDYDTAADATEPRPASAPRATCQVERQAEVGQPSGLVVPGPCGEWQCWLGLTASQVVVASASPPVLSTQHRRELRTDHPQPRTPSVPEPSLVLLTAATSLFSRQPGTRGYRVYLRGGAAAPGRGGAERPAGGPRHAAGQVPAQGEGERGEDRGHGAVSCQALAHGHR